MLLKKTIFQSPKLATRFPLSRFRSQTRQVPRPPCPQARWAPRAVLPPSPRVGPEAPRCRLSPTPSRIPRGRGAALQPWPRTLAMLGWPGSGRPGADFQKEPCEGAPPGVPGACRPPGRCRVFVLSPHVPKLPGKRQNREQKDKRKANQRCNLVSDAARTERGAAGRTQAALRRRRSPSRCKGCTRGPSQHTAHSQASQREPEPVAGSGCCQPSREAGSGSSCLPDLYPWHWMARAPHR